MPTMGSGATAGWSRQKTRQTIFGQIFMLLYSIAGIAALLRIKPAEAGCLSCIFGNGEEKTELGGPADDLKQFHAELGNCDKMGRRRVRQEVGTWNFEEKLRYRQTVTKLRQTPDPEMPSRSVLDAFTAAHIKYRRIAHNNDIFLLWHRHLTYLFEEQLRKIDPLVAVGYVDWGLYYLQPFDHPVFEYPLWNFTTGRRKGDCSWRVKLPKPHCLRAFYDKTEEHTFYSRQFEIDLIAKERDFSSFAAILEHGPHNLVHATLGGSKAFQRGDFAQIISVNDPRFFHHHAYIDKVFSLHTQQWGNQLSGEDADGTPLKPSSRLLHPFDDVTLKQALDYKNTYCYTYETANSGPSYSPASREFTPVPSPPSSSSTSIEAVNEFVPPPRLPDPLPADWIALMNMNIERVRHGENAAREIMRQTIPALKK